MPYAAAAGMARQRAVDVMTAVHELAASAVRHRGAPPALRALLAKQSRPVAKPVVSGAVKDDLGVSSSSGWPSWSVKIFGDLRAYPSCGIDRSTTLRSVRLAIWDCRPSAFALLGRPLACNSETKERLASRDIGV